MAAGKGASVWELAVCAEPIVFLDDSLHNLLFTGFGSRGGRSRKTVLPVSIVLASVTLLRLIKAVVHILHTALLDLLTKLHYLNACFISLHKLHLII